MSDPTQNPSAFDRLRSLLSIGASIAIFTGKKYHPYSYNASISINFEFEDTKLEVNKRGDDLETVINDAYVEFHNRANAGIPTPLLRGPVEVSADPGSSNGPSDQEVPF